MLQRKEKMLDTNVRHVHAKAKTVEVVVALCMEHGVDLEVDVLLGLQVLDALRRRARPEVARRHGQVSALLKAPRYRIELLSGRQRLEHERNGYVVAAVTHLYEHGHGESSVSEVVLNRLRVADHDFERARAHVLGVQGVEALLVTEQKEASDGGAAVVVATTTTTTCTSPPEHHVKVVGFGILVGVFVLVGVGVEHFLALQLHVVQEPRHAQQLPYGC
mmetsp:Transcript_24414/g.43326  ORF Transcript_24414/g.43326 Transcript_24414/m.43326 type:complete len:219 (+) Transcript_24414:157-813(+)